MTANEIRAKFLKFFSDRGHTILPSASLVTTDDKGITNATLFNTAGMQPLIPYLLGEPHEKGQRLASAQKCIRTVDIDDVGDNTHNTFFEMLGNWSLGDYFKEEAIKWSFEFLTSKEEGLGLDPNRLYITVFEGDENAPKDNEAFEIWQKYIPKDRIYFMPAENNWWAAGDNGPCGPDTEMFYDVTPNRLGVLTKEEFISADGKRELVEIWNDVFMQYQKEDGKVVGKLKNNNVDTGAGLERLAIMLQGKDNVYETDLFTPVMNYLDVIKEGELKSKRIVADHLRASVFLISDKVFPFNTGRGYVLRRLIRRAALFGKKIGLTNQDYLKICDIFIDQYKDIHPELDKGLNREVVKKEVGDEISKFFSNLNIGLKKLEVLCKENKVISGIDAFNLFSSYGLPIDITVEYTKEKEISVDIGGYEKEMKSHQDLSRAGAEQKFKGGLADDSEEVVKYHTATHLLNQALHEVLGEHVEQRGSNITAERLRFDFSHPAKMTDEEKQRVEEIVNEKIKANLPVKFAILPKAEAEKTGARHMFNEKYGEEVKVYYIGDSLETAYSKEFCGGPHVESTGILGTFKITKEEAVAAGIRRIKAVLE